MGDCAVDDSDSQDSFGSSEVSSDGLDASLNRSSGNSLDLSGAVDVWREDASWYSPLSNLIFLGKDTGLSAGCFPLRRTSESGFSYQTSEDGHITLDPLSERGLGLLHEIDRRYVLHGDFSGAALAMTEFFPNLSTSVCCYLYLEMLVMSGRIEQALSVSGVFLVHFPRDHWGTWYHAIILFLAGRYKEVGCLCSPLGSMITGPDLQTRSWCFGDIEAGELLSWLRKSCRRFLLGTGHERKRQGLSAYVVPEKRQSGRRMSALAKRLVGSGHYEEGLEIYNHLVARDLSSVQYLSERGDLLFFLGRYSEALDDYTRIVGVLGDSGGGHWARGEMLRELGYSSEALHEFDLMLRSYDCVDCRWHRGAYYQELGDTASALADYSRAVEQEPKSWEVYLRRYEFYDLHKMYEEAVQDYCWYVLNTRGASELHLFTDGLDWEGIRRCGKEAVCRRIIQDYIGMLNDILSCRREDRWYVYRARGFLHHLLGCDSESLADYQRAVSEGNANEFVHVEMGWILERAGRYEEAERSFNLGVVTSGVGNYKICYLERARFFRRTKSYSRAYYDYGLACLAYPVGDLPSLLERGETLLDMGKLSKASHEFDRLVALYGQDIRAYWGRGHCRQALGKYREALDDFNHAVELNPDCGESFHRRGLFLQAVGRMGSAEKDFARWNQLDPYHGSHFSRRLLHEVLDWEGSNWSCFFGLEDRRLGHRRGRRLSDLQSGIYRVEW